MTRLASGLVSLLLVSGMASAQAPVSCKGPLSMIQLIDLMKNDVPPARVQQFVLKCAVKFDFDHFVEIDLREAGATDAIIGAVRDKAQKPPRPPAQGKVGETILNPRDLQKYVWIPAGKFQKGCLEGDVECDGDEKPREAEIRQGFWLGQTEVTVEAWKRYEEGPAAKTLLDRSPKFNPGWKDDSQPMVGPSWFDAAAFCRWIGGRLPNGIEWEYAARAGSPKPYYGELDQIAWYGENSGGKPHPVGQKQPNAFALFDMLGNVWEYTHDSYAGTNEPSKIEKGGAWNSKATRLRVWLIIGKSMNTGGDTDGWRCAWD